MEDGFVFLESKSNDPSLHDQVERKQINPDHLCLDSTSYFHQMFDPSHLDVVKKVSTILRGSCNASTNFSYDEGWYKGLLHMWLVCNGIANLLSLPQLESEGYYITYYTLTNWIIHVLDGPLCTLCTELVLKRCVGVCKGFPYLDMADPDHRNTVVMLQSVRENMAGLTDREAKKAVLARKAQARLGTPTEADLIDMVSKVTLTNCPVTPVDISNTHNMFGPDLLGVKRKIVQCKTDRVEIEDIVSITSDYHCFVSVTLTADVMFVNGMSFLITLSWRSAKQLGSSLTKIVNLYARGGFIVNVVLMDQEFDKIVDEVP